MNCFKSFCRAEHINNFCKHLQKWLWADLALLALLLCVNIEFEVFLAPCMSDAYASATNDLVLNLSYSYIAAAIFHLMVNVLPHERRKFVIEPMLRHSKFRLNEYLRLSKESIIPFANVLNKYYNRVEYAQEFEKANLHINGKRKGCSILDDLERLRLEIKDTANLMLSYREYMEEEDFNLVAKVLKSIFVVQGIYAYPDVEEIDRNGYYGTNQYEVGECIYDLYEDSKKHINN